MELICVWLWLGIGFGMATDYYDSASSKSSGWIGASIITIVGPMLFPILVGRVVCQKVRGTIND